MTDTISSINNVPIRLTDERWAHITEEHAEVAGRKYEVLETLKEPDFVVAGNAGECLAVKDITRGKHLVVVYKELVADGFVITAFLTRRLTNLQKRRLIWPLKD